MVVNSGQLELNIERLARARRVVVHRSPALGHCKNGIGYFVCDYNNIILFPTKRTASAGGASAEEASQWLLTHRSMGDI